jgi:hypothetical protein
MLKVIQNRVNKFSEEMLLHYAAPNRNLVVEILMMDAATVGQLGRKQLSQYVIVLGQHMVTLQYNENLKAVDHMLLSKTFEYKMGSAEFTYADIKGTTAKTRRAWLLLNVPELNDLHELLLAAEAEKMVIAKMTNAIEGLLNALKKELSNHYTD